MKLYVTSEKNPLFSFSGSIYTAKYVHTIIDNMSGSQ